MRLEQDRRRLLIEHGGYVPTDDGLLRITTGKEAEAREQTRQQRRLIQEADGKVLMIDSKPTNVPEYKEAEAEETASSSKQLTIKGKAKAIQAQSEPLQQKLALTIVDHTHEHSNGPSLVRTAPALDAPDITSQQLVIPNALPQAALETPSSNTQSRPGELLELNLPKDTPLARALKQAGLPETALVDQKGQVVFAKDMIAAGVTGGTEQEARIKMRAQIEAEVMGSQDDTREKVVPMWAYKVSGLFQGTFTLTVPAQPFVPSS